MVSAATVIQDQMEDSCSDATLLTGRKTLLDVGPKTAKGAQLNEQFPPGTDYALKVRKPYTITKQRERWTEEEHKKFLEALKLYGRAWRRIEEHVGTKTAVQIRSHAQKFFSKVVRESSNDEPSSVKPIEIPPPRPKRKPMHPYPRKLVVPLKAGRSTTPNSSVSEPENQSPTSVLSAIGSEFLCTIDSSSPNGSLSPVSSAAGVNSGYPLFSEPSLSPEGTGSPSEDQFPPNYASDDQVPVKLELFPEDNAYVKDELVAETSSPTLKLFGKTVLITDSHRPSQPMARTCKSLSSDMSAGIPSHTQLLNFTPAEYSLREETFNHQKDGAQAELYCIQVSNDYLNQQESGTGCSLPWWAFSGGIPLFNSQLHIPIPTKAHPSSVSGQTQDREANKEGSWTGSNTGSVNTGGDGDKNWEVETESVCLNSNLEKEQKLKVSYECSEKAYLLEQRTLANKRLKGFVPYKKRFGRERDTHSSTITGDESEEKRVRLCL